MVIEDNRPVSEGRSDFGSGPLQRPIAGPVDRLAASIIDIFILYVVGSLILAPFFKKIREAQLVDRTEEMVLAGLLMLLVMGLVSVVYQFVMNLWKGASVGKLIFGLRVIDVWTGKKPLTSNLFVRAVIWWLDSVLLAIPHLGVFADPLRRPLHDRVANTMVVSTRISSSRIPKPSEMLFVKSILVAFYVLGFTVLLQEVRTYYSALEADQDGSILDMMSPVQCDTVTDAGETWPQEAGGPADRISVALALYAAGAVDEECLNQEAFLEFKSGHQREMGYLARAFATSDESDLSDRYLEKVCEKDPDSEPCLFSQVITDWTNRNWAGATEGFNKMLPNTSVYVKVWAIKHFEKIKEFDREIALIDSLWPLNGLSSFLSSHRTVGYWGQRRFQEARAAAVSSIERASREKQVGLAGWMCYQELSQRCDKSLPDTCKLFDRLTEDVTSAFSHELYAVTHLKVAECGAKMDLRKLEDEISSDYVLDLARAMKFSKSGNEEKAIEKLSEMVESIDPGGVLMNETAQLALSLGDEDLLTKLKDIWESSDEADLWDRTGLGVKIVESLIKASRTQEALAMGLDLLKRNKNHEELRDLVVIAAHRAHQWDQARRWLNPIPGGRAPARADELERIRKDLEGRRQ